MTPTPQHIGISICSILMIPLAATAASAPLAITVDCGGQHSSSASYTMDGCLGMAGTTTTGEVLVAKTGYIAQLSDVTHLAVTPDVNPVNEGATAQMTTSAMMDDTTITMLNGTDIVWNTPIYPVASLSSNGVAIMAIVHAAVSGMVTGNYRGVSGVGTFLVLDSDPDNYGIYAGDQVSDGWQVRYFGTNNPLGLASMTNVSGQRNIDSYVADLDPTNATSRLFITAFSNHTSDCVVYFSPASTGRVYALQVCTNLLSGVWTNITPITNWGGGSTNWLSATNTSYQRHYRIAVQLP